MERVVRNAVITGTSLFIERGSWLSVDVVFDYGGISQCFGGFILHNVGTKPEKGMGYRPSCAGHFIARVMEVAGVTEWTELKGRTVRVDCDEDKVYGIGHIVRNDWFYPRKDFGHESH